MKALPKRKGNLSPRRTTRSINLCLNESPSEKEGKLLCGGRCGLGLLCLNESPSEKEGKSDGFGTCALDNQASMKALPKRKGNWERRPVATHPSGRLNESPSEKEGKLRSARWESSISWLPQ